MNKKLLWIAILSLSLVLIIGCTNTGQAVEGKSQCKDKIDNDGDGFCDYPYGVPSQIGVTGHCIDGSILGDPECSNPNDESECDSQCTSSTDCGSQSYVGLNYCGADGNVYRDSNIFSCVTSSGCGACSSQTIPELQETCQNGCLTPTDGSGAYCSPPPPPPPPPPPSSPLSFSELLQTTGNEGEDATTDTGVVYTYSGDLSTWIRSDAYDAITTTPSLMVELIGNDATPPYWGFHGNPPNLEADGSIPPGSRYIIDTMGDGDVGVSYHDGFSNDANTIYLYGYFENRAVEGADSSERIFVRVNNDGGKAAILNLGFDGTRLALVDTSNTNIGGDTVDITDEHFVELLMVPGERVKVWIDNSLSSLINIPYSSLPSNGGQFQLTVGDRDTTSGAGANSKMSIWDLKEYRLG